MKKFTYTLIIAFFVLLAGCNMHGHKLYADGDSDDGRQSYADKEQDLDHSLPTDSTWQSAYDIVTTTGASHAKASIYATTYIQQRQESKSVAWASAYAEQIAQSKTPQEARIYAYETEEAMSGWGEIFLSAYKGALLAGHSDDVARRYAKVYLTKRREGQSIKWVAYYARKFVFEGKSHDEAHAYADEVEQGWGTLDALSTNAQFGDFEKESLGELFKIVTDKGNRSLNFATTFANTYLKQREQGKSHRFAFEYAELIAKGHTPGFAHSVAIVLDDAFRKKPSIKNIEDYYGFKACIYMLVATGDVPASERYSAAYAKQIKAGKSVVEAEKNAMEIVFGKGPYKHLGRYEKVILG